MSIQRISCCLDLRCQQPSNSSLTFYSVDNISAANATRTRNYSGHLYPVSVLSVGLTHAPFGRIDTTTPLLNEMSARYFVNQCRTLRMQSVGSLVIIRSRSLDYTCDDGSRDLWWLHSVYWHSGLNFRITVLESLNSCCKLARLFHIHIFREKCCDMLKVVCRYK